VLVYFVRRLAAAALTALLAVTMAYLALLAIPGDPVQVILGMNSGGGAALGARLGVSGSPAAMYLAWLAHLARGDLGNSINYGAPVAHLIAQRLPVTLPIVAGAALMTFVIALPLGILAARQRGRALDAVLIAVSQVGTVIPSFWLGLLLILLFGVRLRWLPTSGFPGWAHHPAEALASLLLPMLAIGLTEAAIVTRQVRGSVLDQLEQDYVRTARSKGASQQRVLLRHVLPNAAVTILTVVGLEIAQLLTGSLIVENVFALPGIGSLALTAIGAHDYPLVEGVVLFYVGVVIVVNLAVDVAYQWLDPRIRYA